MLFTIEKQRNSARREYLYDGPKTALNNKIFVGSISKLNFTSANGTYISQTLRAPGDYVGGRDCSLYTHLKRASFGNSYL